MTAMQSTQWTRRHRSTFLGMMIAADEGIPRTEGGGRGALGRSFLIRIVPPPHPPAHSLTLSVSPSLAALYFVPSWWTLSLKHETLSTLHLLLKPQRIDLEEGTREIDNCSLLNLFKKTTAKGLDVDSMSFNILHRN